MRRTLAVVMVGTLLAGCASSGTTPTSSVAVYPAKGQSAEQQSRDMAECQAWARQQSGYDPGMETAKGAGIGLLLGAAAGAATGAAVGAATGSAGRGAAAGAAIGGIGGGVGGGVYQYSRSKEGFDKAYAACMQGRGYSVAR